MVVRFKVQSWKCFFCDLFHSIKLLTNVCHSAALNVISGKDTAEKSGAQTSLGQIGLWSYKCCSCSVTKMLLRCDFFNLWHFLKLFKIAGRKWMKS